LSSLILLLATLLAAIISYVKDRDRTRKALLASCRSFLGVAPALLGMTALIGLVLALLPPGVLGQLFKSHGWAGFFLVVVVGSLITIPAPIAYPLAGSLLEQGVSLSALAAFITTLTMVGVVTAPMEIAYFGRRFTIARQSLSFVLAILIGALMGVVLP